MALNLRKIVLCLAVALALCAAAPAQRRLNKTPTYTPPSNEAVPQWTITLFNGETANPWVRFTVAHVHGFNYCWGYLDVSGSTVSYHSLNLARDSFTTQRPINTRHRYNDQIFDLHVGGRNYDFFLVTPDVMRAGAMANQEILAHHVDPTPAMNAINDWDNYVTNLKRELHVGEKPVTPPNVVVPPKPKVATLHVVSEPGNAQVYLDDRFKGMTGQNGELVIESSAGDHVLRVDLANYKEYSEHVTLTAGTESQKRITLQPAGPKPLSEQEVEDALSAGMPATRVGTKVKQYGVDFELTSEIEQKLRAAGADDDLLGIIAKNKR